MYYPIYFNKKNFQRILKFTTITLINKMDARLIRYEKIDFLGEGQVIESKTY